MPAEADVVEGFAEESDETHTLWISRGDGSNGGNRKKFAWTWTLVRCPRGWTYSRIWTCCYSYRVIKYYSVNSRVSEISSEPFLHAIIMKMGVSGAKTVPKRKTPLNFAIQRSFFLTIP